MINLYSTMLLFLEYSLQSICIYNLKRKVSSRIENDQYNTIKDRDFCEDAIS